MQKLQQVTNTIIATQSFVGKFREPVVEPPMELIASFMEVRTNVIAERAFVVDNFNDLDQHIIRDTSCKVSSNEDLIDKVNDYGDDDESIAYNCAGGMSYILCCPIFCSLNCYHHVTAPGYFAHYVTNGKNKLYRVGRHFYYKATESWIEDVEIDDESKVKRDFGSKCLVNVTQGYLGGAYRLYAKNKIEVVEHLRQDNTLVSPVLNSETGEYVIFNTGRHVLPQEQYRGIDVVKLESKLVNNLRRKYEDDDKNIMLIYGNWGVSKQMRNIISTPMIGLKRMLNKHFNMMIIDEFRKSCLDNLTHEKNTKVKIIQKNGKSKELNSVLVSKIPGNEKTGGRERLRHQNRNKNAVKNFKYLTNYYITTGKRPEVFTRKNIKKIINIEENDSDESYDEKIKHTSNKLKPKDVIKSPKSGE
jgi:hypothetical protein